MGMTCTSLHVLRSAAKAGAFIADLKRGYQKVGFDSAKDAAGDDIKQVVVIDDGQSKFVSIHDGDNASIDSGELKELAVAVSKRQKSVAVLTSVYDSDRFEFIVFHNGKQVDAVVSDADDHTGGLKVLSAKRRATVWTNLFLTPDLLRDMQGTTAALDPQRPAAMVDRQRQFEARLQRAAQTAGAFAEDGLAAWCDAAGLNVSQALAHFEEILHEGGAGRAVLSFRKLLAKPVDPATASLAPCPGAEGAVKLALYRSDDDCPYLRYYPAAWPITVGDSRRVKWLALSLGAGFSGLRLVLDIDDPSAVSIAQVSVHAFPFYNGQMTSMTPIAACVQAAPAPVELSPWQLDLEPLEIPALEAEARKQIIFLVGLEFASTSERAFTIRPAIAARSPATDLLRLPALKLQPRRPSFVPCMAKSNSSRHADALLRLNEPAVLSMVAILDDDGEPVRRAIRDWSQAWLKGLEVRPGAQLSVQTHKHMSQSFRVAKTAKSMALSTAQSDKQWPRLFDLKSDYQTVMLGIEPSGAIQPIAGITWQSALRDGLRDEAARAAHVHSTIEKHLPPSVRGAALGQADGTTLSFAVWMLNDRETFDQLGVSAEASSKLFEEWMSTRTPVQAWISRSAWIPEFDLYERYNETLYEAASDIDWFRSGLNGMLTSLAWSGRRLQFIAPLMWLGADLAGPIDTKTLHRVAEVTRCGSTLRVALRAEATLNELEAALEPILPKAVLG